MKKFVQTSLLAGLMMLSYSSLQAQTYITADCLAYADVAATLGIQSVEDVMFGQVGATTPGVVYLDPKGIVNNYVGVSAQVGTLHITGENTASIQLSWNPNISMLNAGSLSMNYIPKVFGSPNNVQSGATELVMVGGRVTIVTSATGHFYLWVGGALGGTGTTASALSNQAAGDYMGTVTFAVVYN